MNNKKIKKNKVFLGAADSLIKKETKTRKKLENKVNRVKKARK